MKGFPTTTNIILELLDHSCRLRVVHLPAERLGNLTVPPGLGHLSGVSGGLEMKICSMKIATRREAKSSRL